MENITEAHEKPRIDSKVKIIHYNVEKKIRVGVIGVGNRIVTLMKIMVRHHPELVEFVAISDESKDAIQICLQTFLWEGKVDYYENYMDLIQRNDIDWVMIGSKNALHREQCIAAFQSGKHVFCEKPLAVSIEECVDIRNQKLKYDKLFATGFVLRHTMLYSKIHDIVNVKKELGKIISVEANETLYPGHGGYIMRNWRRHVHEAGPHMLEKCCHDIDILSWIIGSVPSTIASFGGTDIYIPENQPKDERVLDLYKTWDHAYEDIDPFLSDKSIEDNLVSIMQFRNGVKCTFHTNSNTAWPQRRLFICGTKGTLEADLVRNKVKWQIIGQKMQKERYTANDNHGGGDDRIIEDLAKCMAENSTPKATGEEGFISALICFGIDEARRTKSFVNMEPVWEKFGI